MTASGTAHEVPARVIWHDATPVVEIRRIESGDLGKAFWDDVVMAAPVKRICAVHALPPPRDTHALNGGIFHTYRCGSTLLCRQLSAISGVYAIAEPAFLYQLVMGSEQDTPVLRERLLRLTELLSAGMGASGRNIVIKWPGLLGDRSSQLVAALPDVPMIFLTRNPVEVLASIEQRPLGKIDQAFDMLGLSRDGVNPSEAGTDVVDKAAAVIAHLCRRVATAPTIRHCDYHALDPVAVAQHFCLKPDRDESEAMAAAGSWYSKTAPGAAGFSDDSAEKHAAASVRVHRLAAEILEPALKYAKARLAPLAER